MAGNRGKWWDGICSGWCVRNAAHRGVICTRVSATDFPPVPLFSYSECLHSLNISRRLLLICFFLCVFYYNCPWRWRQNLHVKVKRRSRSGYTQEGKFLGHSRHWCGTFLKKNPLLAFNEQNKPLYCARPLFLCSFMRPRKKAGWKPAPSPCILSYCKEHKLGRNHSCSAPDCHKSSLAASLFPSHIHRQLWITVKSLQVQHFSLLKKASDIRENEKTNKQHLPH